MKKVITYGSFDLFHQGHYNLLKRAKEQGDYLIVGVTTDSYDQERGKLNIHQNVVQRIESVRNSGLADEIIIEEYQGQKVEDIQKYNIDTFVIGSDWEGKFDYLKSLCQVIYLERTKGISSTQLRSKKNGILKLGIVGAGRIATRFVNEVKYVSGVEIVGVFSTNLEESRKFAEDFELEFFADSFEKLMDKVDALYIATPHKTHYEYIKKSLKNKKHVLSEKPLVLLREQIDEIYELADKNQVVLLEAIKTAYCPGFLKLISIAKSGLIGEIKDVEGCFTKLTSGEIRELSQNEYGGSVTELATYPLLPIIKLLGKPQKVDFYSYIDEKRNIDLYTKILLKYSNNILATSKVGLGVKSEGELIISGTKGYIYVPAPWWKTNYFEVRFEDFRENKKYFYQFAGDGLRYELSEFLNLISNKRKESHYLTRKDSKIINEIICDFVEKRYLK